MNKLTLKSLAMVVLPMGLVAGLTGCATDASDGAAALHVSPAQPGAQQKAATEERTAEEAHGIVSLIAAALSKIALSDEQRAAIEKLGPKVHEAEQKVAEARRSFREALAEQLAAGKVDAQTLQSKIDALVEAREEASPVLRKALEQLHGILEPNQRVELADTIEGWMKDLAESSRTFAADLGKDLNLSDEQKGRIRETMDEAKPQLEEERTKAIAVFEAFKNEKFSMEDISPVAKVGEKTRVRAEAMVERAKALTSILTPEQRQKLVEKLATKAEEKSEKGKKGEKEEEVEEEEEEQEPQQRAPQPQLGPQQQQQMEAPPLQESIGTVPQGLVVRGGYRAGAVRGWGGGYGYRAGGYRVGVGGYRVGYGAGYGYRAGYPLVGGYGPDIW
jgi:Spy/CpxP family protein refolding chaperone